MFTPRTRDYIYLTFLIIHIPATLLVDLQALFFAEKVAPRVLRSFCESLCSLYSCSCFSRGLGQRQVQHRADPPLSFLSAGEQSNSRKPPLSLPFYPSH